MDANKLKGMMKHIEDAMAAVSFAEEGEAEAAETLFRRERRVLLALKEGHLDGKALKYAMSAALRVSGHLDVLFVAVSGRAPRPAPLLEDITKELQAAGVPYRIIRREGCLKQEIIEHTNTEHDILFVVVESPASLDADCRRPGGVLTELWKNLRCPLVVVADQAGT